ncbi:MAG: SRPBCC family protein [Pseudonocardiales bacterium]
MTSKAQAGDRILGTLRAADGKGVVRMQDRFDTDIDDLWSALTDPRRLARWLGEFEGDLRLGGEFRARFFSSGWEGAGRVEACEPPRRLLVVTDGMDEKDEFVIEATLAAEGDQTVLVVEERGMPLAYLAAFGSGIQVHVEDLGAHLAGRERCDGAARMDELLPAYEDLAAKRQLSTRPKWPEGTRTEEHQMTSNARAGIRILGTLRSADGKGVVRMQDRFDTGIDDLWSALTDPRRLARWLGEVDGDLHLGGQFHRRFYSSGAEGTGRVDACEPPRRLLLTMDPGQPAEQVIEVTLAADGDQAILAVEERGMPLDHLAAYGAGIQVHVEDLAAHLAGRERCDSDARWDELQPAYEDLAANVS